MARGECFTLGRASSLWRETMAIDKVPITVRGLAALEEELKHRQQVERQRIIQAIAEARALGDLSENAEYHAAKEAQSHNEGRVARARRASWRAQTSSMYRSCPATGSSSGPP
jgi:transcription elongation factor GreA